LDYNINPNTDNLSVKIAFSPLLQNTGDKHVINSVWTFLIFPVYRLSAGSDGLDETANRY